MFFADSVFDVSGLASSNEKGEIESLKKFYFQQYAPSTLESYRSDWKIFCSWCRERGFSQLPADPVNVATFLCYQAEKGLKASTISRRRVAIRYYHSLAGAEPYPTDSEIVRAAMRGIRRTIGLQREPKEPLIAERIKRMVQFVPDTLIGKRDKAILLLGFAGAFRRSELIKITVRDLLMVEEGMRVILRRSKTDQEGAGQIVPVIKGDKVCPVTAVKEWIKAGQIESGPIFRRIRKWGHVCEEPLTGYSIGRIVKIYAEKAGYDPSQIAGHSLRSGFLTSAAMNGASIFRMMAISRHKSMQTLQKYVRMADEFNNHAGKGLL